MERNKQSKIIAIVALCVAVVGLTVGFAAFSNILTIQSSATVTPDKSDFKMTIYGVEDISEFNVAQFSPVTSTTMSQPKLIQNATATNASIDNSTLTIKNMDVNFIKPYDQTYYFFKIVNEGKYTAYITRDMLNSIYNIQSSKTCTADVGTSEDMVQKACSDGIEIYLGAGSSFDGEWWDSQNEDSTYLEYFTIPVCEYFELEYGIFYHSGYVVDGNFDVNIPDLKLEFSTVEPTI
jgi:hypothetical protein